MAGWGTRVRVRVPARAAAVAAARVRVLVAAPHPITRAGVVRLLAAGEPALQVAGEVDSVDAALDAYRLLAPDVVLAHLDLPDPDGLAGVKALAGARPGRGGAGAVRRAGTRSTPRPRCGPAPAAGWSTTRPARSWPARCSPPRQGRAVLPAAALSGWPTGRAHRPGARGVTAWSAAGCGTSRSPSGW